MSETVLFMEECDAVLLLQKHNLKMTNQRLLILNELIKANTFFSAQSLYPLFENEMDLATIYRIITTFQKKDMIREVAVKDGVRFYELICTHRSAHPHFLCNQCNNMFCLEIDITKILKLKNITTAHKIKDASLLLNGICEKCK